MQKIQHQFGLGGLLALSLILSACGGSNTTSTANPGLTPTSKNTPKSALNQQAFASCNEFKDYYSDALAEEILTQYYYGFCFGCEPAMATSVPEMANAEGDALDAGTANNAPSREISDTNTQEAGVDEPDIVETHPNGELLFILRQGPSELLAVDITDPAQPALLSRSPLEGNRQARGLFFDAQTNTLAVILDQTYYYAYANTGGAPAMAVADVAYAPQDFDQGTEIRFFDVSNPGQPQELERFLTDGYFVDARRIDNRLHLISRYGFPYPETLYQNEEFRRQAWEEYPQAYRNNNQTEMARLEASIRGHIDTAVANMSMDQLLPQQGTQASGQQTLACERILHPQVSTRLGLMLLHDLDMNGSNLSSLGSINNAWKIYASRQNLYLLQDSGGWWWDAEQRQQTAIYRFDLSSGSAQPASTGLIDGWLNNAYQLSEWQDHLRAVSTETRYDASRESWFNHHHLSVLDVANLNPAGSLADFINVEEKPRETIRSARFMGDKAFVVTFEQIDPLFSFDLSDPANPELKGQLDIPGFSSYMHPLDENHLLTIGRNAGEAGVGTGRAYQLQIFDVSDLSQPTRIASHEPSLSEDAYAYSLAEYDPHAFNYLHSAGLLSIPVQISAWNSTDAFSGFISYRIDSSLGADGVQEYARIDHKDEANSQNTGSGCPDGRSAPESCDSFAPVIYNQPLRSVILLESGVDALPVLGNDTRTTLFTLSSARLKSLDASGAQGVEQGSMELAQ